MTRASAETDTQNATIYVRQSLDRQGQAAAVDRQEAECRALCAERGWRVREVFRDNNRSATSGKERPGFEALLTSKPDRIVVWHYDRLARLGKDLERVIGLEVAVHAVAADGNPMDLASPHGRVQARIGASIATYEGEHKAERQRSKNVQDAADGKPWAGRRTFGYSKNGMELQPDEAAEFERMVNDLLGGATLRWIVRGLAERGIKTTAGNPWKPTEVRRLLQNPRHAGLRVYRGEVVGNGVWPAIIDEDTHHAACAILSDPRRKKAGRPRRYLLTTLARCSECGGNIYGVMEPRGPLYYCGTRKHVARRAEQIDALVEGVVLERLSRPDAAEAFAREDDKEHAKELREEERQLRARLDGLAEAYAAGDIDLTSMRAGSRRGQSRLTVVSEELGAIATTPNVAPLLQATDVRKTWEGLDIDRRRSVIDLLVEVTIYPAGRGARRFDPDTVRIDWRTDRVNVADGRAGV